VFLGVDPGATGALAAVLDTGNLLWVEDMPDPLHGALIGDLLDDPQWGNYVAAVEAVHSMPGQGVSSTFKFGTSYGIVLGALGYARIPYRLVTPNQWKKAMRVTSDKDTARERATELWPGSASLFARKKDNGRAEAALIARWLWETTRASVAA
jgi:hypothetical protein